MRFLTVSNFHKERSTGSPHSYSAFNLSNTQAYLDLPSSAYIYHRELLFWLKITMKEREIW
jgi:hypothetical protein